MMGLEVQTTGFVVRVCVCVCCVEERRGEREGERERTLRIQAQDLTVEEHMLLFTESSP